MNLLDFYQSRNGTRFTPQYVGQDYVYLKGERYNHVSHIVCRLESGHPNVDQPAERFSQGNAAQFFVNDKEEGIPAKFVSSETRKRLNIK